MGDSGSAGSAAPRSRERDRCLRQLLPGSHAPPGWT